MPFAFFFSVLCCCVTLPFLQTSHGRAGAGCQQSWGRAWGLQPLVCALGGHQLLVEALFVSLRTEKSLKLPCFLSCKYPFSSLQQLLHPPSFSHVPKLVHSDLTFLFKKKGERLEIKHLFLLSKSLESFVRIGLSYRIKGEIKLYVHLLSLLLSPKQSSCLWITLFSPSC